MRPKREEAGPPATGERTASDLAALMRMHNLSARLLGEAGIEPLLQEIMDAAAAIMRAQRGTLQLLEGGSLRIAAHHRHRQPFLEYFAAAENCASVCGEATRRGERVIVPDVETSSLFLGTPSLPVLREAGVRAIQSTPLIDRSGRLLGIITTQWDAPHEPDAHDLWRLDLLARQAADLIEIAQTREALRESEQRMALAAGGTRIGMYEWNVATGESLWTEQVPRLLGLSPAAAATTYSPHHRYRDWFEAIHPDDRAMVESRLRRAMDGRLPHESEYRVVWRDGSVHWVVSRGVFQYAPDGQCARLLGIIMDITERKQAEEALRESNERLTRVLEAETVGVMFWDLTTGCMTGANDTFLKMTGYSRAEMESRELTWQRLTPPEYVETSLAEIRKFQVTGRIGPYEKEYFRKDGSRQWFIFAGSSLGGNKCVEFCVDISAQKRAEAALRQVEQRLGAHLQNSPTAIIEFDPQFRVTRWSKEAERMFGWAPEEVIGRALSEMKWVYNDDAGMVDRLSEGYSSGNVTAEHHVNRNYRKDGSVIWCEWYNSSIYGPSGDLVSVLSQVLDITERKRAEEMRRALAEQEKLRLGAAVEQASDSVVILDLEGAVQYVNASFERLNGIPRAEAVGHSFFDFLAGRSPDSGALKNALAERRPWHGHFVGATRAGRHAELEVTVSQIRDPSGTAVGHLVTEKDRTQANALERHLRESQKMEALGTLAGGITHDFNNLLAAITMSTEIALLDLEPSHPARAALPTVLKAASRGKELVKQIITFSRQKTWDKEPLELGPLCLEAVTFLRSTLPRNVTIREHIAPGAGAILGNSSQIYQVIVNLAQNAAQAMERGQGVIDLRLDPVEVDAGMAVRDPELNPGPYARLTVTDTGCGIAPEHLPRLFEPFFTTRKSKGGSGLGLAVVHGIVKSYGGAITVESAVGRGSVFQVFLPRWAGPVGKGETAGLPPVIQGHGIRLLLVEDETVQRNSLAKGLRRMGFRVTSRPNGRGALEAFRLAPQAYDLVVTDQIMPGMTGLELAAELVNLRADIPVILATGYSENVDAGTVGRDGICSLIMKPFTLQEVAQLALKTIVGKGPRG